LRGSLPTPEDQPSGINPPAGGHNILMM